MKVSPLLKFEDFWICVFWQNFEVVTIYVLLFFCCEVNERKLKE
jgi:hypothetical protein